MKQIKPGMKVFDGHGTQWVVVEVDESESLVTLEGMPFCILETKMQEIGSFWSLFTILEEFPLAPKPRPTCAVYRGRHVPID